MMAEGPLAGFPVLDVEVELYDGGFHAVDSSAIAFELQPEGAFRQVMPKAGPQLIEPIMKVDVFTPEDHVGDVIGDLNRRRGMIKIRSLVLRRAHQGRRTAVGNVWLHRTLRTMTSGRGQFSMEFAHYSCLVLRTFLLRLSRRLKRGRKLNKLSSSKQKTPLAKVSGVFYKMALQGESFIVWTSQALPDIFGVAVPN